MSSIASTTSQNGPSAVSSNSVSSSQCTETSESTRNGQETTVMAAETAANSASSQNSRTSSTSSSSSSFASKAPGTASLVSSSSSTSYTASVSATANSGRSYGRSVVLPKPMKSATTSLQRFGKPQQIAANSSQSSRGNSSSSGGRARGRGRGKETYRGGVSHAIVGKRQREDGPSSSPQSASTHSTKYAASTNGGKVGEKRSAAASNMPKRKNSEKAMKTPSATDGHDFHITIDDTNTVLQDIPSFATKSESAETISNTASSQSASPTILSYMSDPLFLTDRVAQRVLQEFHSAWKAFSKTEGKAKYRIGGSSSVPFTSIEDYILKRDPSLLTIRAVTSISDKPDDRCSLTVAELRQALEQRKNLWLTKYSSKCGEQRKGAKRVSARPFRGVIEKNDDSWTSQIKVDGKVKRLGRFGSVYEAARAYDRATMQARRVKSYLNFPTEYENAYYTADTFLSNAVNARALRSSSVAIVKNDSGSEYVGNASVTNCDFIKISNRLEHWCYVCNDAEGVEWCEGCGCSVCFSKMDKEHMLCCSICYSEYHVCCLNARTLETPGSNWCCPRCAKPSTAQGMKAPQLTDASCSPGNWYGLGLTRGSAISVSDKLSRDVSVQESSSNAPGNRVETSSEELRNNLESVIDPKLEVSVSESSPDVDLSDDVAAYSAATNDSDQSHHSKYFDAEDTRESECTEASLDATPEGEAVVGFQFAPDSSSSEVARSIASRHVAASSSLGPVLTPVEEAEVKLTGTVCCNTFGRAEAIVDKATNLLRRLNDTSQESGDFNDEAESTTDMLNSNLVCPSLRNRLEFQEEDQRALKHEGLRDCLLKEDLFPSPPPSLKLRAPSTGSAIGDGESGEEDSFHDLEQLSADSSPSRKSQVANYKEKKFRQPVKESTISYREQASRLRSKKVDRRQQASSILREAATSVGNLRKRAGMVALRSLRYPLMYSRNGRIAGSETDPRGSFATALALPPSADTACANERTSMPNEKNISSSDTSSLDSKGEKIRRRMHERGIEHMLDEERENLQKKYKISSGNESRTPSPKCASQQLNGTDLGENEGKEFSFSSLDDAMGFLCSGTRMFRTSKHVFGGGDGVENAVEPVSQVKRVNGSTKSGKIELREDQVIDISSIEQLIRDEREDGRSEHTSQTAQALRLYQELMYEFGR
eukprot:gb/GECG01006553.1/.p1 GENE.gb/GECG01006553.1/~~gb/GECG01006553.1/.p1  ORF type:complete len:1166 (+),score=181.12 gb/GECG01006553.1/:1-3498(+)